MHSLPKQVTKLAVILIVLSIINNCSTKISALGEDQGAVDFWSFFNRDNLTGPKFLNIKVLFKFY